MPQLMVLVGVDGSEGAKDALRWTADLALQTEAEVLAVHVIADAPSPFWSLEAGMTPQATEPLMVAWRERVQRLLDTEWTAPLQGIGVRYRTFALEGNPARSIILAADDEQADLVVVGRRGHGGFAELILGSVGHQLMHHAHCPVVVVPLGWARA